MRQKLNQLITVSILISLAINRISAQTSSEFTPYGKPLILFFANVNSSFSQSEHSKSFELTRAYLGYEYFFSRTISSRINIDIADPGVGKLQMIAFIKNAYIMYKKEGFSARFGMIGVDQFNVPEKQWGYRYIQKSFQDEYNFGPSADLGAALEYTPADFITIDFSLLNGEGYKKIQADSTFKKTVGLTLRPFKGFVLRGYYDMMNHNYNQSTIALFAGYTFKNIKAGIEYNNQKNNGMINNHDFSGISFYTSVALAEKFSIFGRYDNLKSEVSPGETLPWNRNKDGQMFMVGFDYSPTRGVKIAPTYMGWSPADQTNPFTSKIALNFEIKF